MSLSAADLGQTYKNIDALTSNQSGGVTISPTEKQGPTTTVPALGGGVGIPKIINIPARCERVVQPSNWPWVPYWWIVAGCPDIGPLLALARNPNTEVLLPGATKVIEQGAGQSMCPSPCKIKPGSFDRWGKLVGLGMGGSGGAGKIFNIPANCLRVVQPSNWPWAPHWWIAAGCPDDGPMLALVRTRLPRANWRPVYLRYTLEARLPAWQLGVPCVIGDEGPGGGIVFYVSTTKINVQPGISSGGYCLEAAPKTWNNTASDPLLNWGCYGTWIGGSLSTGVGIGTGASNTAKIMADCSPLNIAARRAGDSTFGGWDDWFLPSKGELDLMWTNLASATPSLGDFREDYYWSSSQNNSINAVWGGNTAWVQYFYAGGQGYGTGDYSYYAKNDPHFVRAIRAFEP